MEKSNPVPIEREKEKKIRSLSEEFYSRSPGTQMLIRSMVSTTPTSKIKKEYSNMNIVVYNKSTPDERRIMEQYGLIPYVFMFKNNTTTT